MRVKKYFVPLDDISTFELAVIVANGGGGPHGVFFEEDDWDKIPGSIKRHFGDRQIRGIYQNRCYDRDYTRSEKWLDRTTEID